MGEPFASIFHAQLGKLAYGYGYVPLASIHVFLFFAILAFKIYHPEGVSSSKLTIIRFINFRSYLSRKYGSVGDGLLNIAYKIYFGLKIEFNTVVGTSHRLAYLLL